MNEQPTQTPNVRRPPMRAQLQRLRVKGSSGMFGMTEVIALGGSVLVLVVVIISYLYFLVPARANLQTAKLEQARLQALLNTSRDTFKAGRSAEATVQVITDSLAAFENTRLSARTQGRMDLYDDLNDLIRKNGLRNTSGPNYLPLQATGMKSDGTPRTTNTKWQSMYPGIAISLTVEGPYASLRHFVHDIEASKVFVIINGVELERATENSSAINAEGSPSTPRASLVSLRLDMATYFQRQAAQATDESKPVQH